MRRMPKPPNPRIDRTPIDPREYGKSQLRILRRQLGRSGDPTPMSIGKSRRTVRKQSSNLSKSDSVPKNKGLKIGRSDLSAPKYPRFIQGLHAATSRRAKSNAGIAKTQFTNTTARAGFANCENWVRSVNFVSQKLASICREHFDRKRDSEPIWCHFRTSPAPVQVHHRTLMIANLLKCRGNWLRLVETGSRNWLRSGRSRAVRESPKLASFRRGGDLQLASI